MSLKELAQNFSALQAALSRHGPTGAAAEVAQRRSVPPPLNINLGRRVKFLRNKAKKAFTYIGTYFVDANIAKPVA